MRAAAAVAAASLLRGAVAPATYSSLVPNAAGVTGVTCVGSLNPAGGGGSNTFGRAFVQGGRVWSTALCLADSDGDGYTNGQELGDPQCVWTPGAAPARTTDLSNPGDYASTPNGLSAGLTPSPGTPAPATPTPAASAAATTPQPLTGVTPVVPRSGFGNATPSVPLEPPASQGFDAVTVMEFADSTCTTATRRITVASADGVCRRVSVTPFPSSGSSEYAAAFCDQAAGRLLLRAGYGSLDACTAAIGSLAALAAAPGSLSFPTATAQRNGCVLAAVSGRVEGRQLVSGCTPTATTTGSTAIIPPNTATGPLPTPAPPTTPPAPTPQPRGPPPSASSVEPWMIALLVCLLVLFLVVAVYYIRGCFKDLDDEQAAREKAMEMEQKKDVVVWPASENPIASTFDAVPEHLSKEVAESYRKGYAEGYAAEHPL